MIGEATLGVLQARMTSTRLPGKVLKPLAGRPMLQRQIERVARSRRIDRLIVATSDAPSDDPIAALCRELRVDCYRGRLHDVLDRFVQAAAQYGAPHVIRLTADCPLSDPAVIDGTVDFYLGGGFDYVSNALDATFQHGLDVEVIRFGCLEEAGRDARDAYDREHVTPFICRHPERYRIGEYRNDRNLSHLRWTVDTAEDFAFMERVYESLYSQKPDFTTADIMTLLDERPEMSRTANPACRKMRL